MQIYSSLNAIYQTATACLVHRIIIFGLPKSVA